MRFIVLTLLLLLTTALTACSFATDFVVVNDSGSPVLLRYKIEGLENRPLIGSDIPATLPAPQLRSGDWRRLSAGEYEFDPKSGVVTVSLRPGEALLIRTERSGEKSQCVGAIEEIKEVDLQGASGEVTLKGDQVYKNFGVEPKPFYSLDKNVTCTMRFK